MSGISQIHWKKFEKFLTFVGCELKRERGDHRIWNRKDLKRPIVIPKVPSIPVFVIRNNLRLLSIGTSEYLNIVREL